MAAATSSSYAYFYTNLHFSTQILTWNAFKKMCVKKWYCGQQQLCISLNTYPFFHNNIHFPTPIFIFYTNIHLKCIKKDMCVQEWILRSAAAMHIFIQISIFLHRNPFFYTNIHFSTQIFIWNAFKKTCVYRNEYFGRQQLCISLHKRPFFYTNFVFSTQIMFFSTQLFIYLEL